MGIDWGERRWRTRGEAEAAARADHKAALGKVVRPETIHGINADGRTPEEIGNGDGCIAVRVLPTDDKDVRRLCDDWVDPYWNVEIVEDPEGRAGAIPHPWVYGPSHGFATEAADPAAPGQGSA